MTFSFGLSGGEVTQNAEKLAADQSGGKHRPSRANIVASVVVTRERSWHVWPGIWRRGILETGMVRWRVIRSLSDRGRRGKELGTDDFVSGLDQAR